MKIALSVLINTHVCAHEREYIYTRTCAHVPPSIRFSKNSIYFDFWYTDANARAFPPQCYLANVVLPARKLLFREEMNIINLHAYFTRLASCAVLQVQRKITSRYITLTFARMLPSRHIFFFNV